MNPAFAMTVADGCLLAEQGAVVTFGVVPSKPETGYGYIRQGEQLETADLQGAAYRLHAFVEKPDLETAQAYLASGEYLWNSGIFMLRASVWLMLIKRFRADILGAVESAIAEGRRDGDFFGLGANASKTAPVIPLTMR
jgi:mannose-1-phosphate guanylyltransferase/mannose-6-phosphate isomerase